jgi:hypothetical protein
MFLKDETIKPEQRLALEQKLYAPYSTGRDLRDWDQVYKYRTNIQKYDHKNECMQFIPNFIQVNRRDVKLPNTDLVNLESDLRGITRNLSKVPQARYLGPNGCSQKYNDKGICVCPSCLKSNIVNQNKNQCKTKIINNHHIPQYTDCNTKRTSSTNSNCKDNVNGEKVEQGVMNMIKGFFF